MKNTLFSLLICIISTFIQAQNTLADLYESDELQSLLTQADTLNQDTFSAVSWYILGYAQYKTANGSNMNLTLAAAQSFDKAIQKGLKTDALYYYRGLAYQYAQKYDLAIESILRATEIDPKNQAFWTSLGNCYVMNDEMIPAILALKKACALPYESNECYYKLAAVYQIAEQYEKALEAYYAGAEIIADYPPDEYYIKIWSQIASIEFGLLNNYNKTALACKKILAVNPDDYQISINLIQALHRAEKSEQVAPIFEYLHQAYLANKLPEPYQSSGSIPVVYFPWNNQFIFIYKNLKKPIAVADIVYTGYLLAPNNQDVERTFVSKKAPPSAENSYEYIFCEQLEDDLSNCSGGWTAQQLSFGSFQKILLEALEK